MVFVQIIIQKFNLVVDALKYKVIQRYKEFLKQAQRGY
jgi:hypothetical protein